MVHRNATRSSLTDCWKLSEGIYCRACNSGVIRVVTETLQFLHSAAVLLQLSIGIVCLFVGIAQTKTRGAQSSKPNTFAAFIALIQTIKKEKRKEGEPFHVICWHALRSRQTSRSSHIPRKTNQFRFTELY